MKNCESSNLASDTYHLEFEACVCSMVCIVLCAAAATQTTLQLYWVLVVHAGKHHMVLLHQPAFRLRQLRAQTGTEKETQKKGFPPDVVSANGR